MDMLVPVKQNLRLHQVVHQVQHVILGCNHLSWGVKLIQCRNLETVQLVDEKGVSVFPPISSVGAQGDQSAGQDLG